MGKELVSFTVPTLYLIAVMCLLASSLFWWYYFHEKRETGQSPLWAWYFGLLFIGWAAVCVIVETPHHLG